MCHFYSNSNDYVNYHYYYYYFDYYNCHSTINGQHAVVKLNCHCNYEHYYQFDHYFFDYHCSVIITACLVRLLIIIIVYMLYSRSGSFLITNKWLVLAIVDYFAISFESLFIICCFEMVARIEVLLSWFQNGLWFALGVSLLIFLPSLCCNCQLAKYYQRAKGTDALARRATFTE